MEKTEVLVLSSTPVLHDKLEGGRRSDSCHARFSLNPFTRRSRLCEHDMQSTYSINSGKVARMS